LKTDLFDTIYFLAADRIAREVEYQRIIVGELLKHGKQITINGKDYQQNPENKLTLTMLGAFAEFERAKIIERTTRAAPPAAHGRDEQQRPSHLRLPLREEDADRQGASRPPRRACECSAIGLQAAMGD
jgi:DNA invertase Pin-like site-specific DNA recombinase